MIIKRRNQKATLDFDRASEYSTTVKRYLGNEWLLAAQNQSKAAKLSFARMLKAFITSCYINDVTERDCAEQIRAKFPIKNQ